MTLANKFRFFYQHFVCPAIFMFNKGLLHEQTDEKASSIASLLNQKEFINVTAKVIL